MMPSFWRALFILAYTKHPIIMRPFLFTLCLFLHATLMAQDSDLFVTGSRFLLGLEKNLSASIALGDIDQDGDLDIIVANGRHWTQQNFYFVNASKGRFSMMKPLGADRSTSYVAELGDLNGDGWLDIAVGNDMAPNILFMNDGKGAFIQVGTFGHPRRPTRNLILYDIDVDGDLDIFITGSSAYRGIFFMAFTNNGNSTFTDSTESLLDEHYFFHGTRGGWNMNTGQGDPQFYEIFIIDFNKLSKKPLKKVISSANAKKLSTSEIEKIIQFGINNNDL